MPRINPPVEPLPKTTSTYRDGRGRTHRLSVAGVRKPFDPEAVAKVLIEAALAEQQQKRTRPPV